MAYLSILHFGNCVCSLVLVYEISLIGVENSTSIFDGSVLCWKHQYSKNGSVTALIWGASPQSRSDRRKDRVETNPEQLAAASAQAEISFYFSLCIFVQPFLLGIVFAFYLFFIYIFSGWVGGWVLFCFE